MKRAIVIIFGAAVTAAAYVPAHASGWVAALKNTPAEYFDAEDLRLFLESAGRTLDAQGAAVEASWSNPATGANGRFKELKRSRDSQGHECRRVQFWVSARSAGEQSAIWTACRSADNRWQLTSAR
jgi:surface antigen